jgi:hypothetical protein
MSTSGIEPSTNCATSYPTKQTTGKKNLPTNGHNKINVYYSKDDDIDDNDDDDDEYLCG